MIPEDDKGDGSGLLFVGMGTKNVAPFSLLPFLYQRSVKNIYNLSSLWQGVTYLSKTRSSLMGPPNVAMRGGVTCDRVWFRHLLGVLVPLRMFHTFTPKYGLIAVLNQVSRSWRI